MRERGSFLRKLFNGAILHDLGRGCNMGVAGEGVRAGYCVGACVRAVEGDTVVLEDGGLLVRAGDCAFVDLSTICEAD